jgi:hypothetical protein
MWATDSNMALPDDLLEELLSAHLDGALSGDERARVEQMLCDDPAIGQRLVQLKRLREDFRRSSFVTPKLPDGFSDRVVQAAIRRAEDDQLRPDHPLRLAARDAFVSRPTPTGFSPRRVTVMVAGLAAAALFIGLLVKNDGDTGQPPHQNSIASLPSGPSVSGERSVSTDDPLRNDLVPVPNDAIVMLQDTGPASPPARIDPNDSGDAVPTPVLRPSTAQPMLASSDSSDRSPQVSDSPAPKPAAELQLVSQPLQMLMVIEIEQSEIGRQIGAFDQALAKVQIEVSDEREVDEELARAVANQPENRTLEGKVERVLFLESSAKKLDLLVNLLSNNPNGISAIRFSAITAEIERDTPLLRSIDAVRRMDPTQIRHQGDAFPIVGASDEMFDAWSAQLHDRDFAPIRNEMDAQVVKMMASADNGPDQTANILFLVR